MATAALAAPSSRIGNVVMPDEAWLAKTPPEPALQPEISIVDPHHHLWDRPGRHRYLLPELLADTGSGHDVRATVFVECHSMYRADGDPAFRPVGETEFVNGVAAMAASGTYGPTKVCAGIVSFADLTLGARAREVLEAHIAAGAGRFRGVRHASGWHASPDIRNSHTSPPEGLLGDRTFREGFAQLGKLGLSFDAWLYHPQLGELADLAGAFPDTTVILDHCGGQLGYGPYAGRKDEEFAKWSASMRDLAKRPNVVVKLGGLGMTMWPLDFHQRTAPASSAEIAAGWKPWIDTCIEAFGPERCMFESNFPVDKVTCSYGTLWNAFKRIAEGASAADTTALFSGTASRVYRLD